MSYGQGVLHVLSHAFHALSLSCSLFIFLPCSSAECGNSPHAVHLPSCVMPGPLGPLPVTFLFLCVWGGYVFLLVPSPFPPLFSSRVGWLPLYACPCSSSVCTATVLCPAVSVSFLVSVVLPFSRSSYSFVCCLMPFSLLPRGVSFSHLSI